MNGKTHLQSYTHMFKHLFRIKYLNRHIFIAKKMHTNPKKETNTHTYTYTTTQTEKKQGKKSYRQDKQPNKSSNAHKVKYIQVKYIQLSLCMLIFCYILFLIKKC